VADFLHAQIVAQELGQKCLCCCHNFFLEGGFPGLDCACNALNDWCPLCRVAPGVVCTLVQPTEFNTYADIEAAFRCSETKYGIREEDVILYRAVRGQRTHGGLGRGTRACAEWCCTAPSCRGCECCTRSSTPTGLTFSRSVLAAQAQAQLSAPLGPGSCPRSRPIHSPGPCRVEGAAW